MTIKVKKFSADWCSSCKTLSRNLEGKSYEELNVADEEIAKEARENGIRNLPTTLFYKDDVLALKKVGVFSAKEYDDIVEKLLENSSVMAVYKVVARCHKTGRQDRKKVYETFDKFTKHSPNLIFRWSETWDIEVYELKDDKYELWHTIKTPTNEKELKCMQEERNYSDNWFNYKLKSL